MDRALSTVRSLLFALFQAIVTPPYAIVVLAFFWLPPVARYRLVTGWCWLTLRAARWI